MAGPDVGVQANPAANPAQPPNVFDQSANSYNQAVGIGQGLPGLQQGMANFQNPYTQEVIDRTMVDLGRAHDLQQRGINDAAEAAGAFGGDRHGIQAGLANSEYQKNVGDLSAGMHRQGYLDSANLAGQDFRQQQSQAQLLSSLAGQGFNFGRQLNQDQWSMGQQAQSQQQAIMDAARGQFDANNPLSWLSQISQGMSSNPLGQKSTTVDGYNPSSGEKLMTGLGMITSLIPGK